MYASAAEETIYMCEPEPLPATDIDLQIPGNLVTSFNDLHEREGRVHAAFTQGRDLLTEVGFSTTIVKVIERTTTLLDADWASVCISDPRSSGIQQMLQDEDGHTCVQFAHTAEERAHLLEAGQIVHSRTTCSACRLLARVDWCASVALGTGTEKVGILCAMRSHPGAPFASDDLRVLQVFAEWAAIAIATAQRLQAAQEDERAERRRIAAHLHDNAAQALNVIGLRLDQVEEKLHTARYDAELNDVTTQLRAAKTISRQLIQQIRAAFGELLQPAPSDDLVAAVAGCVDDFRSACEVKTEFIVAGRCTLPQDKQSQAVQIVREALVNVRRHARARSVQVKLSGDAEAIRITVKDDGAGFDVVSAGTDHRHLGTALMSERAQRSGGFLTLHSLPGQGTEVTVHYPAVQ